MLNDVEFREVQEVAIVDKVKIVACDGKSKYQMRSFFSLMHRKYFWLLLVVSRLEGAGLMGTQKKIHYKIVLCFTFIFCFSSRRGCGYEKITAPVLVFRGTIGSWKHK